MERSSDENERKVMTTMEVVDDGRRGEMLMEADRVEVMMENTSTFAVLTTLKVTYTICIYLGI